MQQLSAIHNTFVIERHFQKPPEKVFAALSEPAKRLRWFAEADSHEVEEFQSDFRVGGVELLRYRFRADALGPLAGSTLTNKAHIQDIVPNSRIVTASAMSLDERRISASLVTMELLANGTGTDLICTHQGTFFEGAGDPKMREAGWRTLLEKLAYQLAEELPSE